MSDHALLLLRHAKTEPFVSGHADDQRVLTDRGHRQAAELGDHLHSAEAGQIDQVLCSPSVRTRQTLVGLALDCPVNFRDSLYNAGADTISEELTTLEEHLGSVLVIGHAPGIPGLAMELADRDRSDAAALAELDRGFSPGTLARLEFDGPWADLWAAALVQVRPPTD